MGKYYNEFQGSLQEIKKLALQKGPYEEWRISNPMKEDLSRKLVEFSSEVRVMINEAAKKASMGENSESVAILRKAAKILSKLE